LAARDYEDVGCFLEDGHEVVGKIWGGFEGVGEEDVFY